MSNNNCTDWLSEHLVDLLMEVISKLEGKEFITLIQNMNVNISDDSQQQYEKYQTFIDELQSYDFDLISKIIRTFNLTFLMADIAQERKNYLDRSDLFQGHIWKSSFNKIVQSLQEQNYTAEQVQDLLCKLNFKPVFTAHPTEAKRRTVLQVLDKIKKAYKEFQEAVSEARRYESEQRIKALIKILWRTEEVRSDKPSVVQEIETNLYYFRSTIFSVVPELYKNLHRALKTYYPQEKFDLPKIISFGSWVGGDRDGNPNVTPALTRKALRLQQVEVLKEYERRVNELCDLLTHNDKFCKLSDDLKQDLKNSSELAKATYAEKSELEHKTEPYRRKLGMMAYQLQQRITQCESRLAGDKTIRYVYAYESAKAFKKDLMLIHDSLRQHNDSDLANGSLRDLIRLLDVFDFYLNKLDIRQESTEHSKAIAEILHTAQIDSDYMNLSESDKTKILGSALSDKVEIDYEVDSLSETTQSILAVFNLINEMRNEIGANCFDAYVISMVCSHNHILEVALLASLCGLNSGDQEKYVPIAPLFETIDDLKNAPDILDALFSLPYYKKLLTEQNDIQEVMLGYSDSCKDGGIIASSWNLFTTQRSIIKVADKYAVECVLFHGRGGTVARGGGGNVDESIQSQPASTIRGSIKFTEQGEVLSNRYHDKDTALDELTTGLSALLQATLSEDDSYPNEYFDAIDHIAHIGESTYRSLTDNNEDLMKFFYAITPTRQIGLLNIGSRPSHRSTSDFSKKSIRAIGWVFAWGQCRLNLPGWYGLGTALNSQPIEILNSMYKEFPFFKIFVNKTQVVLAKTNMEIAKVYADLYEDTPIANELYDNIKDEYLLTCEVVKKIVDGSEHNENASRYAYLAPLNYIQVMLLNQLNDEENDESIDPLLRSINAISVGLGNTG